MSDYNNLTANLQVATLNTANIGVGRYILNDYVIEIIEAEDGNGYTMNIRKGSQVQTMHLTELTQEYVNQLINDGLRTAKASGEFDGFSPIATVEDSVIGTKITITDKNGTTTEYVRDGRDGKDGVDGFSPTVRAMETADGIAVTATQKDGTFDIVHVNDGYSPTANVAKNGDTQVITITDKNGTTTADILDGVGISSAVLDESTYQLTLYFTDGTSYTTQPIRGQKGDTGPQGLKGDPGESFNLHVCVSSEYDENTGLPIISNPESNTMYLVPAEREEQGDLFAEWVYVNNSWEKFGSTAINITIPDWEAAEGEDGYIKNKPDLKVGTGNDSITNRHSVASGAKAFAIGNNNTANGTNSFASGEGNTAGAVNSFAIGNQNTVGGSSSFSSGRNNRVLGSNSLASGYDNVASSAAAETAVFGYKNTVDARDSVVGGSNNTVGNAINVGVVGSSNTVSGTASDSFISGTGNAVSGASSCAEGYGTVANHRSQHTFGEYNSADESAAAGTARGNYVEIVGNGTADNARSNARTLDWNGNEWIKGNFKIGGTSYDDPNAKELATKEYVDEHAGTGSVTDVKINGTSIVDSETGEAEIPISSNDNAGVIKSSNAYGIYTSNEYIRIYGASTAEAKAGTHSYRPITPDHQHEAAFYGLAKAAGDTTQSASSNVVGTYTDNAKASIKAMLGVTDPVSEIDDTAGSGDTDKTWSADKLVGVFSSIAPVTSVNGQTGAVSLSIPTKTSDLTNDIGYITNAPVASVNGQTGAVTLTIPSTASDVGAIAAPSSPASGAFLVWNGSAWVAQTLATWQGGAY